MKNVLYILFFLLLSLKTNGLTHTEGTLHTDSSGSQLQFPFGKVNSLFYTGSVVRITSGDLEKRALTNFLKALEGKGSGIQFTSGFGQAGMTQDISIRGYDANAWERTPLFVINGMPASLNLSSLNPHDIESIIVLKDAVGASLYGGKSTSGVIFIETKKQSGRKGFINLQLNQGMSVREIPAYEQLNVNDYLQVFQAAAASIAGIPTKRFTLTDSYFRRNYNLSPFTAEDIVNPDGTLHPEVRLIHPEDCNWEDALLRTANRTDLNLSTGYGNRWASLYLSGNFLSEDGYLIETGLKRYTGYACLDLHPLEWFQAGISANIASSSYQLEEYNEHDYINDLFSNNTNPFKTINTIAPWIPIHEYDENGNFTIEENGRLKYYTSEYFSRNVVNELKNSSNKWKNKEQLYTFFTEFFPLKGLTLHAEYAFERLKNDKKGLNRYAYYQFHSYEKTDTTDYTQKNKMLDLWAAYQFTAGKHFFNVLTGYNYSTSKSIRNARYYVPVIRDQENYFPSKNHPAYEKAFENSQFRNFNYKGQVNYHYNQKYFITVSYTKDILKIKEQTNNRKDFYAAGIAWRMGQEDFLRNQNILKELKWRTSFGKGYNYGITPPLNTLYFQSSIPPYLTGNKRINHWSIGLDFNLWDHLEGTLEYYSKSHKGYLTDPANNSQSTIIGNEQVISEESWYGKMTNSGWELSLNGQAIQTGKFHWKIGLNLTFPQNKIDYLKGGIAPFRDNRTGHPRPAFILNKFEGVNQLTGEGVYESCTSYCGSPVPDFYGTMDHRFRWKNLELSFLFAFQKGGKVYDYTYLTLMTPGMITNFHPDILKRWQNPGDQTSVPSINAIKNWPQENSDRWLTDASYLTMKSISLSWDFPEKWLNKIKLSHLTFYANGENLFLISKRKGLDPQQNFDGKIKSIYGPARILSLGIDIGI